MDNEQIFQHDIKQCLNLIVIGGSEEVTEGWTRLKKYESEPVYEQLNNYEDILREILNGQILNVTEMPEILIWFAKYLKEKPFDINPISNDIAMMLKNTVMSDMSHLTMILEVLLYHKVYLLKSANHSKLCEAIVTSLSTFPMPCYAKKISEFYENAAKVQSFLRTIRSNSKNPESDNLSFICLQTLYRIISDNKRKQEPGPGLATVLELVEPLVIPQAVSWILSESHCDYQLAQALKVLCIWLPKWRGDQLSIWIMQFIYGLEMQNKFSILCDVMKSTFDMMFFSLLMPVIRPNASAIVFHVLKRQGSPALIQNIMKNMHKHFPCLMKEDSESSKDCVQNLVDIMKAIMIRSPGHSVYGNLQNHFPVEPRMYNVREICNEPVWVDETKEFEPIIETSKSHLEKVGLSNLGNTCYMNSVLQALLMTRQFCYEVLMYKPSSKTYDQIVLKKLQNLFTLLLYSKRISLAPTEILLASRPAYFLPGQQQDSSEFLCHLLDLLHEQEKSANGNGGSNDCTNIKCKGEKETNDVPLTEEEGGTIKRWTTEEDLTEDVALQRKTQSLADFTQGEDLAQIQQLSNSHSDSIDSGIQSVGGEEPSSQVPLVHKILGGESKITYQCVQCDTSSHNTDKFRDLQLCFPEEIQENQEVSVQDLINYYLTPEKLTGDNKYRCDKCMKLCDAQRIIKILQAPAHLILILKHFRYDFNSRLRTKLRHKVLYNETIQLPVSTLSESIAETYQLYAAVVHSGYNMDYGHYFTYARDSKQNWYKFNDSYVSQATLNDFKDLKPPDTPYILFYEKTTRIEGAYDDGKPELSTLSKHLQELVANDTTAYIEELMHQAKKSQRGRNSTMPSRKNENSDDENPPPSSCRGAVNMPANRFLY